MIVVGTFLDRPTVHSIEGLARVDMVNELARECVLKGPSLQYFEVSCSASLENIGKVQEAIVKTALSLVHGRRVPKSYLAIERIMRRLRIEKKEMPTIPIEELKKDVTSIDLVKRAWIAVFVG